VIRASVCLFVCPLAHFKNHISESRNFLQYACCLRPWLGPGHIVSSRPYSVGVAIRYVYTPGFADDVMFANSRPAEVKATHKRSSQTDSPGATPGRKQSLTPDDCLVKDRFFFHLVRRVWNTITSEGLLRNLHSYRDGNRNGSGRILICLSPDRPCT